MPLHHKTRECHQRLSRATSLETYSSLRIPWGSGTLLVMDELVSSDTIKDQTEKPSPIIPGVPQTRVFLITTWSSCWIAGSLF